MSTAAASFRLAAQSACLFVITTLTMALPPTAAAGGDPLPPEFSDFPIVQPVLVNIIDDVFIEFDVSDPQNGALDFVIEGNASECDIDTSGIGESFVTVSIECSALSLGIDETYLLTFTATNDQSPQQSTSQTLEIRVDTTPPTIVGINIYPDQVLNGPVTAVIDFSEPIDPTRVTSESILMNGSPASFSGTPTFTDGNRRVVVPLDSGPYLAGRYTLRVNSLDFFDEQNNQLDGERSGASYGGLPSGDGGQGGDYIVPFLVGSESACQSPGSVIDDNFPTVSSIFPQGDGNVADLTVSVRAAHTYVGDLTLALSTPNSAAGSVTLLDRPGDPAVAFGCPEDNIDVEFSDNATVSAENECSVTPPAISGTFAPESPLAQFASERMDQLWLLTVTDSETGDVGVLEEWCIRFEAGDRAPDIATLDNLYITTLSNTVTLPLTATDPDGDPVEFQAFGVPEFCTFSDNGLPSGNAELSCTPTSEEEYGVYSVEIVAISVVDGIRESAARQIVDVVVASACTDGTSAVIPDNDAGGVTSQIELLDSRIVRGFDVYIEASHTFIGDLSADLVTPNGSPVGSVSLINRPGAPALGANGCSAENVRVLLDDSATTPVEDVCDVLADIGMRGTHAPDGMLDALIASPLAGTWSLLVSDQEALDTGTLNRWCVMAKGSDNVAPSVIAGDGVFRPGKFSEIFASATDTAGSFLNLVDSTVPSFCTGFNTALVPEEGLLFADATCEPTFDDVGLHPYSLEVVDNDDPPLTGMDSGTITVAPVNDSFETAEEIFAETGGSVGIYSGLIADGSNSISSQPDVWYVFNPPGPGILRARTCASQSSFGTDTVLSAHRFTGVAPSIADEIAANDDLAFSDDPNACTGFIPPIDTDSVIVASVNASDTILLRVSEAFARPGQFALDVAFEDQLDTDGDGIADENDNCTVLANPDQRDTDGDGFGNICDADLNNDNIVNVQDLGILRLVFFSADADADFNGDGVVNVQDLGILRQLFFQPPGPSGAL